MAVLLDVLPDSGREAVSLEIIKRAALTAIDCWTLVASFDKPWSATFSADAMKLLNRDASPGAQDFVRLGRAIEHASRRLSPDAVDGFADAVTRSYAGAPPTGALLSIERARMRADMHKEFSS